MTPTTTTHDETADGPIDPALLAPERMSAEECQRIGWYLDQLQEATADFTHAQYAGGKALSGMAMNQRRGELLWCVGEMLRKRADKAF
jgi:hypothetical protein